MLSDEEKKELLEMSKSLKLKKDLKTISQNRHNPFVVNGNINLDRLVMFLTEYNYFIGHMNRPFQRIIDRVMKF